VVVSFGWNYFPMVREAKRLMDTGGGVGQIEQMAVQMASVTRDLLANLGAYPAAAPDAAPEAATWTNPALSGGGYGQAQLSHALGLALWLSGLRGKEAFAFMAAPLAAPVELHDAIALRYANGAIGTLSGASSHAGANENKNMLEVRIIGSEGQLHIDLERESVWRYRGPGDDVRIDPEPGAGNYHCAGPIDALVDLAMGRQVENCSPIELGARTVEILDAAYRSARSGAAERVVAGAV
jgi:predicted dehydrogenase